MCLEVLMQMHLTYGMSWILKNCTQLKQTTEYNFSRFNSFHMLDAFAFILQDTLTLFYYYSLPNCSIQFGIHKAILKQSSYKGNKIPFLVLFWVAKEILCTSNLLVSIFLWLLNWRTQSKSSGRQEIEQGVECTWFVS